MRLPRRLLVDPACNRSYATLAIASSMVVFAHSTLIGPIAILLYYMLWLPLFLVDPRRILGSPRDMALPLALALLATASTLWSEAPQTTLRSAIQYLTHFACALAATRVTDAKSLCRGVVIGCLAVILHSLAFGQSAYDQIDGSYTFVGAFGSKNQLGFFASLGIYFGVALVLIVREGRLTKVMTVAAVAIMASALSSSRSATSILGLMLGLSTLLPLLLALRLSRGTRGVALCVFLPFGGLLAAAALNVGGADVVLGLFGKDATLTGRTYLWAQGMEAAWTRPLLGFGYQAYWVQGFSEAERLWAEFHIGGRQGFHFHSTYVETFVELGIVGLGVVAAILLRILLLLGSRILRRRDREAASMLGLFAMMATRSFAEVDMLFPFTIGSFLVFLLSISARRSDVVPAAFRRMDDAHR